MPSPMAAKIWARFCFFFSFSSSSGVGGVYGLSFLYKSSYPPTPPPPPCIVPVAFGFSVASGFFTTVGEFTGALSPEFCSAHSCEPFGGLPFPPPALSPEFCSAHSCEPFGAPPPPLGGLPPKISSNVAIVQKI